MLPSLANTQHRVPVVEVDDPRIVVAIVEVHRPVVV